MHRSFAPTAAARRAAASAALCAAAILCAAPASAACQVTSTELPVTMANLRPIVSASINDVSVKFLLDSGAFYSHMTSAAADRFLLERHRAPEDLRIEGLGGRVAGTAKIVRVPRFTLKSTTYRDVEFLVVDGLAGHNPGDDPVGLLGQNFLGSGDIEYDLAHRLIRLAHPTDDCAKANLAYWAGAQPVSQIELERRHRGAVTETMATASVNGTSVRVTFDTGAATSLLSRSAAERAGVAVDAPGVVAAGPTRGIDGHAVPTWIAPVDSFALGSERIQHTRLRIGDFDMRDTDMLLGADFFLAHRIYVANSQEKLYFTYNGGPVFDLSISAGANAAGAHNDAAAQALAQAPPPADAAGYARRGAAYAALQDMEHALADLTRACELEPTAAAHFVQRGKVYARAGQAPRALSDYDTALRLDPNEVDALLARAQLRLAAGDKEAVRADLDAADRVAAVAADARLDLATLYIRLDLLDAALVQLDDWIPAHGNEARLPIGLNNRCWVRALLGKDLDQALADCDAALRTDPDSAPKLDSRALVHLRLGHLDKALADYDAALRKQPKSAWALYGRGLVHLRNGAAEAGQNDIAAAKAIRPGIEEDARRHGIVAP